MGLGFTVRVPYPVTNPFPSGTTQFRDVEVSPDGNYIAVCCLLAPYLAVWEWGGENFGALLNKLESGVTRSEYV